jgi:hypothetical protein
MVATGPRAFWNGPDTKSFGVLSPYATSQSKVVEYQRINQLIMPSIRIGDKKRCIPKAPRDLFHTLRKLISDLGLAEIS